MCDEDEVAALVCDNGKIIHMVIQLKKYDYNFTVSL